MTMFASHAPGEVIDAIRPDLEAFTSLWTALRINYEGTNITRTVARLLHMYQPEEGVIAYERLLRTLFVLLEDFDSDGLQLLVSMVPPPKGVDEELIKEVFHRATGFVRVEAPIFHKNTDTSIAAATLDPPYPRSESQSCSSTAVQKLESLFSSENTSSVPKTKNNPNPTILNDNNGPKNRSKNSPQIIPQESSEVFRGFPPSEIYNTQSHVQNIKNFYRPSAGYAFPQSGGQNFINFGQIVGQNSGQIQQQIDTGLVGSRYRPKWFQSPYLIQKNDYPVTQYQDFYLKTVNNQFVKVPAAKVNNFQRASINTSQAAYQALYNNQHNYMRNRSNTVTSGLLEKIQRHRSLQELEAVKKIISDREPSKNSSAISTPGVSDTDVSSSHRNVEFKVVDVKLNAVDQEQKIPENSNSKNSDMSIDSKTESLVIEKCNWSDQAATENNNSGFHGNCDDKIVTELDLSGKNCPSNTENFEEFAKEVRLRQRAIQEDIYKMDVVRSEEYIEEDSGVREEADNLIIRPEILTASEELRYSCKKFMDRTKTEELIEVPIFPKTRALNEIHEQSAVTCPSDSNLWRLLTSKNVSGSKSIIETRDGAHAELGEPLAQQELNISPLKIVTTIKESSGLVPKRVIRKKKPEVQSTRPKSQRIVQKESIISHDLNIQDDLNLVESRENGSEPDLRMKSNPQPELTSRCPSSTAPQTPSSCNIGPTTTMAELAAYKKQYYDALLSIQKAKAAVANSLAISSVGSSPGFDPYYYNYLQQQHHQILQRRQHQILMSQGLSQHQSMAAATPWFRTANWRYPVISQSTLPQRPQMVRPSSSMWPPGVGYLGRDSQNMTPSQRQQLNIVQVPKPQIKRRKLEEIVGKLKESESNVTNT